MKSRVHIGTSGWHYKHWIGRFYPTNLPADQFLSFYSRHFQSVEINNSFYRLPETKTFTTWRKEVPEDFTFAVKASRFVTHMKKLKAPKTSTNKLFNRLQKLESNLGPVLFQLPPHWRRNSDRLSKFLQAMTSESRYVFEFRDPSWLDKEVFDLLREHNAAYCIHDFGGSEGPREITTDFTYVRFHGTSGAYSGSYSLQVLKSWARQIQEWQHELKEIYVFFNNDIEAHAIENALRLQELI